MKLLHAVHQMFINIIKVYPDSDFPLHSTTELSFWNGKETNVRWKQMIYLLPNYH